ncbi:hypothetical protein evm_006158 [Chilo suppressalis]|nr:hypothetical protein evm_006158 [Chilo suppressalis]
MQQLSIPEKLVLFICNSISSRSILIRSQNLSLARTVWKGLPQGSPLSPILYSIYTHDMELSITSFCQILQYADDLALYVRVKAIPEATSRLNSALFYLGEWLDDHGLSISTPKCSAVVFTKKRIVPVPAIKFQDSPIEVKDSVKFLGMTLDSRLTGVAHFNNVANKVEKCVNVLRALSGVWWGAHPETQKLIYNAIIRSHFDYGSFLLDPCNKAALDKMDKIQSKCLRIIVGAMKSSPVNALQIEGSDPPLFLRRQYLSDRFFLKILQNNSHPLLGILHKLSQALNTNPNSRQKLPCIISSYSKFCRPSIDIEKYPGNPLFLNSFESLAFNPPVVLNVGIEKHSLSANQVFNETIAKNWPYWLQIYTDASKTTDTGSVGAAVWIPRFRVILGFKIPPPSSIFTGEATAILEAILYCESHNLNKTLILSDSLSCLQAISTNPFRNKSRYPIILKIREALFRCKIKGIELIVGWIPGHSGIQGNESVDSCARNAISTGSRAYSQLAYHDLLPVTRSHLIQSWERNWENTKNSAGKHYFDIQPTIPIKPWYSKQKNAPKQIVSVLCRLRLGHSCTPVHLKKIKVRDSSLCECGIDEGTAEHLLFDCPKLRYSLYDVLPHDVPRPLNAKNILQLER